MMDNPVLHFLNKMADLLLLNVMFLVCCLPVVTIGPALTALYHVSLRSVRYGDGYVVREFFRAMKQNFVQSLIAGLAVMAVGVLFLLDIWFWIRAGAYWGMIGNVMAVVSGCFAFLFFITALWLFPVIAKLENKLWVNVKNAAAMAVGHFFPYTFVCVVILAVCGYAVYVSIAADVILLLVGFSLISYVLSFFFYKVFAKYIEEEPAGEGDLLYGNAPKELFAVK